MFCNIVINSNSCIHFFNVMLLLGIEYMKKQHDIKEMYTGVAIDNNVAEHLYQSIGFQATGLVENGMKELRYVCKE